jgi:hypothetical protein
VLGRPAAAAVRAPLLLAASPASLHTSRPHPLAACTLEPGCGECYGVQPLPGCACCACG